MRAHGPYLGATSADLTPTILTFFNGTGLDANGRTITEIQEWTDEQLEECHDQIQWMFPVPEPSKYNRTAPILTKEDIEAFTPVMRDNLSKNFMRMMKFYGFIVGETGITVPDNFNPYWLTPYDHNLLRLTRILRSLRLLGMEKESLALFTCLTGIYVQENIKPEPRILKETFNWWVKAILNGFEEFSGLYEEKHTGTVSSKTWAPGDTYLTVETQVFSDHFAAGDEVEVIIRKTGRNIFEKRNA